MTAREEKKVNITIPQLIEALQRMNNIHDLSHNPYRITDVAVCAKRQSLHLWIQFEGETWELHPGHELKEKISE